MESCSLMDVVIASAKEPGAWYIATKEGKFAATRECPEGCNHIRIEGNKAFIESKTGNEINSTMFWQQPVKKGKNGRTNRK